MRAVWSGGHALSAIMSETSGRTGATLYEVISENSELHV